LAGRWFGGCLTTRFKNTGNSIFHHVVGLRELRFQQQACRPAEKLSPPSPISPHLLKTPAQHCSRTLPKTVGWTHVSVAIVGSFGGHRPDRGDADFEFQAVGGGLPWEDRRCECAGRPARSTWPCWPTWPLFLVVRELADSGGQLRCKSPVVLRGFVVCRSPVPGTFPDRSRRRSHHSECGGRIEQAFLATSA
jgi:hypothetical protein